MCVSRAFRFSYFVWKRNRIKLAFPALVDIDKEPGIETVDQLLHVCNTAIS